MSLLVGWLPCGSQVSVPDDGRKKHKPRHREWTKNCISVKMRYSDFWTLHTEDRGDEDSSLTRRHHHGINFAKFVESTDHLQSEECADPTNSEGSFSKKERKKERKKNSECYSEKVLLLTWPGPTDTYTRLRKKSSTPIWTDHEINLGSVLDPFINLTVSYLSSDMQHKLQI